METAKRKRLVLLCFVLFKVFVFERAICHGPLNHDPIYMFTLLYSEIR